MTRVEMEFSIGVVMISARRMMTTHAFLNFLATFQAEEEEERGKSGSFGLLWFRFEIVQ